MSHGLKTTRLRLEPLTKAHAEHLFEVMLDEAIYTYVDEEPERDPARLEGRYEQLSRGAPESSGQVWLNWAVKLGPQVQAGGQYLGTLQATIYPDENADVAYMFSPAFWGRGYAAEATRELCRYLFYEREVLKIHKYSGISSCELSSCI